MEGSFYCRQILKARQLGVMPSDVPLRYMYYVSVLRLAHHVTLSARLREGEGVFPLCTPSPAKS
jgi:hypothetical protein